MQRPAMVIDNGTGYTKVGFAGNSQPSHIVPSVIATRHEEKGRKKDDVGDLDYYVGDEALARKSHGYDVDYPVRHGIIANWDDMEKVWMKCIFSYLRCDPEEHFALLTEPPMNTPENREYTAEVMFETFNVPGLYIAVQAVLALCASILTKKADASGKQQSITGTVIDSGDGVTHVIPVVDGYVIGSCIRHIPLAGRDVTNLIMQILRERGEKFPPEDALQIARVVKERFCYVCPDVVKEYNKYDADAEKFRQHEYTHKKTKARYTVDVGYERFIGPEIFFSPEIFSSDWTVPLPEVVDRAIQACPIDSRRQLYNYITLSGGSTLFRNFSRRLGRDISRRVDERLEATKARFPDSNPTPVAVNVVTHAFQRFAVWFGGSMLASHEQFSGYFHTKADYEEQGPRIARHNPVFASL